MSAANFVSRNHSGVLLWGRRALHTRVCSNTTAAQILENERSFQESCESGVRILGTRAHQDGACGVRYWSHGNKFHRSILLHISLQTLTLLEYLAMLSSLWPLLFTRTFLWHHAIRCTNDEFRADVNRKDLEEESAHPRQFSSPHPLEVPYVDTITSHTGHYLSTTAIRCRYD